MGGHQWPHDGASNFLRRHQLTEVTKITLEIMTYYIILNIESRIWVGKAVAVWFEEKHISLMLFNVFKTLYLLGPVGRYLYMWSKIVKKKRREECIAESLILFNVIIMERECWVQQNSSCEEKKLEVIGHDHYALPAWKITPKQSVGVNRNGLSATNLHSLACVQIYIQLHTYIYTAYNIHTTLSNSTFTILIIM